MLNIFTQFTSPIVTGIIAGILCKIFFNVQQRRKIKSYQADILKSRAKIGKLEAKNQELESRIADFEGIFSGKVISMN